MNAKIIAAVLLPLLVLVGCASQPPIDWRAEIQRVFAEENDQSMCEETILGGPEDMKFFLITIASAELGDKTVKEARESDAGLFGAIEGEDSSSDPTSSRMDEIAKSIPDDTPAMEVVTVAVDAMFAVCNQN